MHLDHVGIATDDATGLAEVFGELFDAPVVHEETFNGLEIVFLDVGSSELELLEPLSEEGTVARFLDREGPGLHHIAVEVSDVNVALQAADELGLERIDESSRPGAKGHEVGFLHPESTGGVLVEFVEQ